jgi:hypothetical protein
LSTQESTNEESYGQRAVISDIKLWALLDEKVQRGRSPQCGSCRSPVPLYRERADAASANWNIVPPEYCDLGCHEIILDAVEELAAEYDVSHAVWAPSLIV